MRRMLVGVLMSLAVHLVGALAFAASSALSWLNPPAPAPDLEIETASVSEHDWAQNHATTKSISPLDSKRKETPKQTAKVPLPNGQIVDVARGNDQKADDAKYLAEHDNRVEKETRARETTPFYGKAMPQQTTDHAQDAHDQAKLKGNQGSGSVESAKSEQTHAAPTEIPKSVAQPKVATLEHLSEDGETRARGESNKTEGNGSRLQVSPGVLAAADNAGADGKAGTPEAQEHPSAAGVKGAATGAAPNDFLNQVPIGDGTFLNTREFKYASFFNRIKQRVGEQWRPIDAMRHADQSELSRSRVTVVDVVLDDSGRVSNLEVSQSCGVDSIDNEALAAFKRASPFPNPPTGLLEDDRHIRFRFSFHIENDPMNARPVRAPHGRW